MVERLESRQLLTALAYTGSDDQGNPYGFLPREPDWLEVMGSPSERAASYTAEDTFRLHSLPGAEKTIYLDFDGHITTGTAWNQYWGIDPLITPPYDIDGDPDNFSPSELQRIQRIWKTVAEDYRPFDVNVTTEDPGVDALRRTTCPNDSSWGIRVVFGADQANTGYGGIAYINSFRWYSDTPTFVFNVGERGAAEAASHEVGHTLGLFHHGTETLDGSVEYYAGHGSGATGWAPIMGVGYYRPLVQWSRGDYPDANNPSQDDLEIITTGYGVSFREDDHGDTLATATPLNASQETEFFAEGIIERPTDVDFFCFQTGAGPVTLQIDPFHYYPNLDILALLYDENGQEIATSNPPDQLYARFEQELDAGTYYLSVEGTGKPPQGSHFGYSDYGSLGYYSISGQVAGASLELSQLSIDGLEASFRHFEPVGASGTVDFLLRNAADSDRFSGPVDIEVWLRPEDAEDTTRDTLIGSSPGVRVDLEVGASESVAVSVQLPVEPGNHLLIGRLRSDFAPGQTVSLVADTLVQTRTNLIDLGVHLDTEGFPLVATAGDRVSLSATIQNLGSQAIRGTGTLEFLAAPAGSGAVAELLVQSRISLRLTPSGSSRPRLRFVMPSTIAGGNYDVLVRFVADDNLGTLIPGQQEDHAPAAMEVLAPDLRATAVSLTRTPAEYSLSTPALGGSRALAVVDFENPGPGYALGTATVRIYAVLEGDGSSEPIPIGQVAGQRVRLRPGSSQRISVSVVLPESSGDYRIQAEVDPGGSLVESDDSNNTAWTEPFAIRAPFVDLAVDLDGVDLPEWGAGGVSATAAGVTGRMQLSVTNTGNITVRGTTDFLIFATTDPETRDEDILLGRLDNRRVSLAPGRAARYRVPFSLPEDMPPEDYYLFAQLLPDDRILELRGDDSPSPSAMTVTERVYRVRRPDLVAEELTVNLSSTVLSGERGTATVTISNAGEVPAGGAMRVGVFAVPLDVSEEPILLGDVVPRRWSLNPGAASQVRVAISLPVEMDGEYRLQAEIDIDQLIDETDIPVNGSDPRLANNTVEAGEVFTVEPRHVNLAVDLAPEALPSGALASGDRMTILVGMENQGNVSATGTVRIELYALALLDLQQPPTALDLGEAVPLAAANVRVRLAPAAATRVRIRGIVPSALVEAAAEQQTATVYVFAVLTPSEFRGGYIDSDLSNHVSALTEDGPLLGVSVPLFAVSQFP